MTTVGVKGLTVVVDSGGYYEKSGAGERRDTQMRSRFVVILYSDPL